MPTSSISTFTGEYVGTIALPFKGSLANFTIANDDKDNLLITNLRNKNDGNPYQQLIYRITGTEIRLSISTRLISILTVGNYPSREIWMVMRWLYPLSRIHPNSLLDSQKRSACFSGSRYLKPNRHYRMEPVWRCHAAGNRYLQRILHCGLWNFYRDWAILTIRGIWYRNTTWRTESWIRGRILNPGTWSNHL